MPRKGYRAVTLPDSTADMLYAVAKREGSTAPKLIKHMLDQLYPEEVPENG